MRAWIVIPRGWRRVVGGKVRKGDRLFITGKILKWILAEKWNEVGVDVSSRYCVIRKAATEPRR